MRICMLIDAWFPLHGGGQVHVINLSERLVKHYGYHVDILTRQIKIQKSNIKNLCQNSKIKNLKIFRLGPISAFENVFVRVWWLFWVIIRVLWENRRAKYDVIHAHAFLAGFPGKILSILLKIPIVYTVHGTSIGLTKKGFKSCIEKFVLTGIHYTQEISVAHNFLQFPNVNRHIEVIPNGVDVGKIKYQISNIKNKNQIKKKFIALFVGRFDKIKGVHILIEAVAILKNKSRDLLIQSKVQFHLVGFGYEEDNLKQMARRLGLDHIVLFKGKKIGDELAQEYANCDLFILPSLSEGHPLTLFEAWAAKKPVLVTAVGDNSVYVKDGINGFLVAPNSAFKLAEAIKKALLRKGLDKLGENGYKLVKSQFSWETMTEKTVTVYRDILCNSKIKMKIQN